MATAEEDEFDIDAMEITEEGETSFQRTIWQLRLLPYHKESNEEADFYFSHIKAGLAYSVLMRDARPGLIYWVHELDRFIQLYSYRFTKPDHINILKMLYKALTMRNLDFRVVKVIAGTISTLLFRKSLLSRKDIQFEWRPLYNLYIEIAYKNLEEDGLILLPIDMKKTLSTTILECNHFFADAATQEILDEVRPYFCSGDDSFIRGASILAVFVPTALDPEEHNEFGAKLWIEELISWITNPVVNEKVMEKFVYILARLAKDCPGYYDLSPHFAHLFSLLLASLKLELGVDKVTPFNSGTHMFNSLTQIIAYSFGTKENKIQEYIGQLFLTLESYFHPSNTGLHTTTLLNFLLKLCSSFMYRCSRERHQSHRYRKPVPKSMQMTDEQVDAFVKSILPCLEYAAFSKVRGELMPSIIRILSFLSPGIIIPFVLDLVYPSLQTVTEPHRLTQSLQMLSSICVPLVRDNLSCNSGGQRFPIKSVEDMEAHLKSYRKHAIVILNNILPGLDINDISKSTLTFQIITILLLLIPVVDCSQAPQQCTDLSQEEAELCSATASFDCFIDQLMERIFTMIELLGSGVSERNALSTKAGSKNMEEFVIEKGILTVFRALIRNCSSSFYTHVTERFYEFAKQSVYNSKPAMNAITLMASSIINGDPNEQFQRFFKFAIDQFNRHYHSGCEEDEDIDHHLIWYISFVSDIVRGVPGEILLQYRTKIEEFIDRLIPFKSPNVYKLAAVLVQHVFYSICSIYTYPIDYRKEYDQPFDKFLPIRHWAKTIQKDKWTIDWHVPSDEEVDFAGALADKYVTHPLQNLLDSGMEINDKKALKILTIARFALEGCSCICPFFDGPILSLIPITVPNSVFDTTPLPSSVKRLTALDGSNYRRAIFKVISQLADAFLKERENDTKSSLEILHILRILMHRRGCDSASFHAQSSTFQMTKRILADPLRGIKETIETIMDGSITLMHIKRILHRPLVGLTATHLDALHVLFRFATSLYSIVRYEAQKLLDATFIWWSFSYKLIIDDLLPFLKEPTKYTYEQFKGALYILVNGKDTSILVRQDWEALLKIWPVLCLTQSPDAGKQSAISLLDISRDLIINNFSSFQIEFTFPKEIFPLAEAIIADYEGNVHKNPLTITQQEILASEQREAEMNERNKERYVALIMSLYEICVNKELHWRHVDFAQALLSLLLRRDARMPDEVILHFFKLIISDSIKTRKMAIGFCGSWAKINRQKAHKIVHPIEEEHQNLGPGAKWPIKYGLRNDNRFLIYEKSQQPNTAEEWNSTSFFHKPHWGFYTWPHQFRCYAPPAKQDWANRKFDQLSFIEQSIVELLRDREYRNKFVSLYSMEEKKGSEEFDALNYTLFYRIFRAFNDILLEEFSEILDPLLQDPTEESQQRLASEMIAGMICGAKLWRFDKQEKLIKWLEPRLLQTFIDITKDSEKNWGTALATIFGVCEPRQAGWLIQMLFQLVQIPTEISSHIKTRLYLLHCALNQCEWRVPTEWRTLAEHCLKMVDNTFQNVRLRIGSCLATTTFSDLPGMVVDPNINGSYQLVTVREIVERINSQLQPLWNEALDQSESPLAHIESNRSLSELMETATEEHKQEKLRMTTLINFFYSMNAHTSGMDTSAIELIPLMVHFTNDNTNEELKGSCGSHLIRTMGLAQIFDDQIDTFFATCRLIQEKALWWKSKITLLRFLQVFTFSNLFVLRDYANSFDQLREIIINLLVDSRFEVRVASAETLSGLIRAGIITVDSRLLQSAEQLTNSPDPIKKHSGVLVLSAIVLAYPYSVPQFLPDVLMKLCKHASAPEPIFGTVKRALSDFKRTHQDEWHEHKLEFTEDQLQILTNLIVSPNYYV